MDKICENYRARWCWAREKGDLRVTSPPGGGFKSHPRTTMEVVPGVGQMILNSLRASKSARAEFSSYLGFYGGFYGITND